MNKWYIPIGHTILVFQFGSTKSSSPVKGNPHEYAVSNSFHTLLFYACSDSWSLSCNSFISVFCVTIILWAFLSVSLMSVLLVDVWYQMHLHVENLHPTHYYASPSSGEAYRDRQLTTNFEFWVEIFCVPTCFHKRIPKPCLSVCPSVCPSVRTPRKEITLASSISVLHW